jgi:putative restriction endonuclease
MDNGILLRSEPHKLCDLGYVTVTPTLELLVSKRLKGERQNGEEYYAHHGHPLGGGPQAPAERPSAELLAWHSENRFRE